MPFFSPKLQGESSFSHGPCNAVAIPRDSAKLLKGVHPYGSNGGAFAQDQPDLQSIAPCLMLRTRTAQGQWESRRG